MNCKQIENVVIKRSLGKVRILASHIKDLWMTEFKASFARTHKIMIIVETSTIVLNLSLTFDQATLYEKECKEKKKNQTPLFMAFSQQQI